MRLIALMILTFIIALFFYFIVEFIEWIKKVMYYEKQSKKRNKKK